jgi:hypothetical protein
LLAFEPVEFVWIFWVCVFGAVSVDVGVFARTEFGLYTYGDVADWGLEYVGVSGDR